MHSITFECKVITPMFLAGADGSKPELRAPSIKGALRFWWRALNGQLALDNIVNEKKEVLVKGLKYAESEIFGGTSPALKSKVNLRVKPGKPADTNLFQGKNLRNDKGSDYFLYSLIHQNKTRKGINPERYQRFKVILSAYPDNISALQEAVYAFWILVNLGGIGTRVRRGAGAFRVVNVADTNNLLSQWNIHFVNSEFERSTLREILEFMEKRYKDYNQSPKTKKMYSNLRNADIYIGENLHENWKQALDEVGFEMFDLRYGENVSYTSDDLNQKAAFGLPITVRQRRGFGFVNFKNQKENNRRASNLFISAFSTADDEIRWVVTHFKDDFMPPKQVIKYNHKEWKYPDNSLLKEFLRNIEEISY